MKIISIEPTPSPNSMKLNMDERLPLGKKLSFTNDQQEGAPDYIKQLLSIEGVKGIYQVADFISIDRYPNADWPNILSQARSVFGESVNQVDETQTSQHNTFGEVQVYIQFFRDIPMQVKLTTETEHVRLGLPERFTKTIMEVQKASPNVVMERQWVEQGVRYGELKEIGEEVVQEIDAAYDEARLLSLVSNAIASDNKHIQKEESLSAEVVEDALEHADWMKRYAALERMDPTKEDIPVLRKALRDESQSVRRLATVYLGMIGGKEVLPLLIQALKDKSVSVRRTAGDTLSDLGDPDATLQMVEALQDQNKLVRWRAARFLYEVGDERAIPALVAAQDDREFEVSLQVKLALERIEGGEAASGTVWQQMTKGMKEGK